MNSSGGTSTTKTGSDTPSSTSASIRSKRDRERESESARERESGRAGRGVNCSHCLSPSLLLSRSLALPLSIPRPSITFPLARLKSIRTRPGAAAPLQPLRFKNGKYGKHQTRLHNLLRRRARRSVESPEPDGRDSSDRRAAVARDDDQIRG